MKKLLSKERNLPFHYLLPQTLYCGYPSSTPIKDHTKKYLKRYERKTKDLLSIALKKYLKSYERKTKDLLSIALNNKNMKNLL